MNFVGKRAKSRPEFLKTLILCGSSPLSQLYRMGIITVAVSINNNLPAEAVIPLGMTIGYAAAVLSSVQLLIAEIFVPIADKYIAEDNQKKLNITLWLGTFCSAFIIPTVVCVAGVLLGGDLLDKFINSLPAFILNGIGAAGAMLPALGISMILSLLVNTRTAIYFMSGFVIYKYLGVDMIFMLVIGLLLAITDFTVSAAIQKNRGKAQQNAASEEEEFLS